MLFVIRQVSQGESPETTAEDAYVESKRREYVAALRQQQARRASQPTFACGDFQPGYHRPMRRYGPMHSGNCGPASSGRRCNPESMNPKSSKHREGNGRRDPAEKNAATPNASSHNATSRPRNGDENEEPHWSAAPRRSESLAEISSINRTFASLKNTFVFPIGELESIPNVDTPRLAYNTTNSSIHAYENALSELLTKLDAVDSFGFKGVREARKQLVVKIEKALEDLEKTISERLTNSANSSSTALPDTSVPITIDIDETPAITKEAEDVAMFVESRDGDPFVGYEVEPVATAATPITENTTNTHEISIEVTETAPVSSFEVEAPALTEESRPEIHKVSSAVLFEDDATESGDDSEIEDAVHVTLSSEDDEEVSAHGSSSEVEYELI